MLSCGKSSTTLYDSLVKLQGISAEIAATEAEVEEDGATDSGDVRETRPLINRVPMFINATHHYF